MKDCVIIGKGPAGLSAALYVRRAGYTPLVIGRDSGALGQSHRIENYFGLAEPVSGDELFRRGLVQVERLGIEVISDEVVSIRESNGFIVNTSSGSSYTARTVLLATGKQRISSNLDADHLIGYGVSHCAQCDGFLMRGRSLSVVQRRPRRRRAQPSAPADGTSSPVYKRRNHHHPQHSVGYSDCDRADYRAAHG